MSKKEKMNTWFGWAGRILEVDLSRGKVIKTLLPRDWVKRFLGGRGIQMKILFDRVKSGIDPFSPKNVLILGTGPLTGTMVGSRCQATSKSPLTGFLGDSNAGGHWGAELKFAGYDHIVVSGKSKEPVYLFIDDDHVEIRKAGDLWGRNVWETTERLREEIGDPELQILSIGEAGENLVLYAAIMNSFTRAFGRTGMGAIMGSKRLKAVAVRGTRGIKIAKPKEFIDTVKSIYEKSVTNPMYQWYPKYGTPILTDKKAYLGNLPVKNWSDISIEGVENVTGEAFVTHYVKKNRACYGCFYHCDHFYQAGNISGPGLEYEAVNAFGPRVGNTHFPTILEATNLANQYGLDVVSTGGSIALAMDLYERGVITEKDTDGLEMKWGNREAILQCIHKIAKREGFGNLLAEGPYLMAQQIGGEAPSRVMHFKRLDPTAVEVRPFKGQALSYATSTRGADHLRGLLKAEAIGHQVTMDQAVQLFGTPDVTDPALYDTVGKPKGVYWYQKLSILCDCLEICKFNTFWAGYPVYFEDLGKLLSTATGVELSVDELERITERVLMLEKAINAREGYTRKDDLPCERMINEPIPRGPFKGEVLHLEDFEKMLDAYYELSGCDVKTGIPKEERLFAFDLPEVAKELKALGIFPK
jgi:aldehyde:ferredoxin oxidoreductase